MASDYLLTEDGFKILLEDGSGALLLESSDSGGTPTDEMNIITINKILHIRSIT